MAFQDRFGFHEFGAGPGHFEKVLGRLFPNNIDDIVYRDDPHQFVHMVHHRHRQNVVPGDQTRHLFLIGIHPHEKDIGGHEIPKRGFRGVHHQLAKGTDPYQPPVFIHAVKVEGHFHLLVFDLKGPDRFSGGGIFPQGHEIGHHDAAGGVFGIPEQLLDLLGAFPLHLLQNGVGFFIGKLFQNVGDIVAGHRFQDPDNLIQFALFDEFEEGVLLQFAEDKPFFLVVFDHIEQLVLLRTGQIGEYSGEVGPVGFADDLPQMRGGIAPNQSTNAFHQNFVAFLRHGAPFIFTTAGVRRHSFDPCAYPGFS